MTATSSLHTVCLYIAAAAAIVLLAPYAGCHILTSPPDLIEDRSNYINGGLRSPNRKPAERPNTQPGKPKNNQLSDLDELLR